MYFLSSLARLASIMRFRATGVGLACCLSRRQPGLQAATMGALFATVLLAQTNPQAEVEVLAAKAEKLEAQNRWDEAAAAYLQILRIDPQSIAALNRLGALFVRQGKFQTGIQYYQR